MKNKPLIISGITIYPGERITLALPTPELYPCAKTHIPMHVIHGKKNGPVLLVSAGMHGDGMNGIAMIEKLLNLNLLKSLSGTIIAIPVLNIYSLIMQSRDLPDHRDLEKAFPGSETGSFAARLANLLTTDIFNRATHCIDLHSGEPRTDKLSQIHTSLRFEGTEEMVKAFQAPVVIDTDEQRGLLRLMHQENPIPTIIFDTGEAMRINREGVREGVKGIVRVMRQLKMLPILPSRGKLGQEKVRISTVVSSTKWIRSPCSGLWHFYQSLGSKVKKGALIARVSDPLGTKKREEILSPFDGIVISISSLPIAHEGDPTVEIGEFEMESEKSESNK
jgi:uncharacterized protein